MCTILIAHQVAEQTPLLVLANRDEFYARPTAAMAEWPEMPGLIAGRDLASGGTWFGARDERWASITNVREGRKNPAEHAHQRSRGWLVLDYLQSDLHPADYLARISASTEQYAGYNLLLGDGLSLWYASNRSAEPIHLPPGIYGLSNGLLDSPWPKVLRGKQELKELMQNPGFADREAFSLLTNTSLAGDDELPDTGVPYAWEKLLSATFIMSRDYGTRCSTLLRIDKQRHYRIVERRYQEGPEQWQQSEFTWAT